MASLDWPGMLQAGLVRLGLRPAEFWALTPAELMMMLGLSAGGARGMARARLSELAARFPDCPPTPSEETQDGDT